LETRRVAVVGGTVFDGTERGPISDGCLVVRDDHIEYVGPYSRAALPTGAEIIEATGHAVLPGIIDGHMHLTTMPAFLDTNGHLQQNIRAISKLRASMASGVTSVVNVGGCAESQPLKAAIEDGVLPPMARMLVAGMLNSTGGHVRGYAADGGKFAEGCDTSWLQARMLSKPPLPADSCGSMRRSNGWTTRKKN
jgi:imidazolonepropionase-like amidohydrolase